MFGVEHPEHPASVPAFQRNVPQHLYQPWLRLGLPVLWLHLRLRCQQQVFATSAFSEDVWGLGMWTIFIAWSSREQGGWSAAEAVRGDGAGLGEDERVSL